MFLLVFNIFLFSFVFWPYTYCCLGSYKLDYKSFVRWVGVFILFLELDYVLRVGLIIESLCVLEHFGFSLSLLLS